MTPESLHAWPSRVGRFSIAFLLAASAPCFAQQASKLLVAVAKLNPVIEVRSPGLLQCEGGQPGTDPQGPPCSPGTKRILIWNRMSVMEIQESIGPAAAMYRGKVSIVAHCSFDENYSGHCWGTYTLPIPELGGHWEGTWTAPFDLFTGAQYLSGVAFGRGGKLEGLQIKEESVAPGGSAQQVVVIRVTSK